MSEYELSGSEWKNLTQAQHKEYDRLKSNVADPPPIAGESWFRPFVPGLLAGLAALLIFVVSLLAIQSSLIMIVMAAEVPLLFAGWLLVFYIGSHSWRRRRRPEHERALVAFVAEIRYQEVTHATVGDDDTRTERQRQHDWYRGHTELDWRDREAARKFGMSADEWSSNMSGD